MKLEQSKFNQNLSLEQRNKLVQKSELANKETKEEEQNYNIQLISTNTTRDLYIETNKKILNEFQLLQESYTNTFKDSLIRYNQFYITYSNSLHSDLLNQLNVIFL